MPEKNNNANNGEENNNSQGQEETKVDAFGEPTVPVHPNDGKEGEEGDGGEKGEEKKYDPIPDDHPTVVALKQQIEDVKKEYGGNLSGQRDLIKTLEGKIEALTQGNVNKEGDEEVDVLYKDIKWSKDLTKEEREEMTDTEIKQMDEIAEMKTAQNKMYAEQQKKAKEGDEKKETNLNDTVRNKALELSKDEDGKENKELANQIIESFQSMKFDIEGLSASDIEKRVELSANEVPDYKAPKEQVKKGEGKAVETTKEKDDPFGVDAIVDEATSNSNGNYKL